MNWRRHLVLRLLPLLAAMGLAACGTAPVGPNYRQPDEALASQPSAARPFAGVEGAGHANAGASDHPFSSESLPSDWWRLYQDPVLDRLVAQALAHNTDLRQAAANLERAHANEAEVAGAQKPGVAFEGAPVFGHESGLSYLQPGYVPPNEFLYNAGFAVSYQLDLFGQIRRSIEAAEAGTGAAEAGRDLVRVNVAAGTARAYAQSCALGLRLQVAQKSVQLQAEAVDVSERLHRAGRAASIDEARARAQLEQLKSGLPPLQAEHDSALFRLATLTGSMPRDFPADVAACTVPPRVAGTIPVGDGASLLRRRPDVRQAERSLAQATANIGVATADLYPKVTLGLAAASAGPASGFGHGDTINWSLGPLISWSLPVNGVAQARIAKADADTRAALAKFDGTVLTALRETETALSAYARELDRGAALEAAREQSAIVATQARQLYRNGKTGYLEALDAERVLATSESALAASDAQLADDQVALFLALGGGW